MKKVVTSLLLMLLVVSLFGQTKTGTLKVFSDIQGITVFVDDNQQANYKDIKDLPVGTHYVKVLNGDVKIYGQVVTINADQVTTILIEDKNAAAIPNITQPASQKPVEANAPQTTGKTGTINIFSELKGITIYLNENKQGDDIRTISNVPVGNHYLKVLKDGISIFGELVTVTEGQVTSVLIKNNGEVAEKIMESKTPQREEYGNSKVDVLLSSNAITQTQGKSTMFPGFYGYYGYSSSVSNTTQVTDFKIIQGGVKEIGDLGLAGLVGNKTILDRNARDNAKALKMGNTGGILLLGSLLIGGTILADVLVKKPFLHKAGTAPNWEAGVFAGTCLTGIIGYGVLNGSTKTHPAHYYNVDDAAKDAQAYNRSLKIKLGLPENYDMGKN
jgi:hypothetical protein